MSYRLTAGPVTRRLRRSCPPLPGSLALGWVGDGVVVVIVIPADRPVGLPTPGLNGLLRRVGRDQPLAPADQIGPAGLDQGLTDGEIVLRLKELHQGPMELAVPQVPGHFDRPVIGSTPVYHRQVAMSNGSPPCR